MAGLLFSGDPFSDLFAWLAAKGLVETFSDGTPKVPGIPSEIVWFLVSALLATWVLLRAPVGTRIFAVGGDASASMNSGFPMRKVKISLFKATACCAAMVAIVTDVDARPTAARGGLQ